MRARWLLLLAPAALAAACDRWVLPPEPVSDRLALFDQVWSEFDRHYALFELGGFDWAALGAVYRDSVRAAGDERETARLIGAMIGRLRDYHSGLSTPFGNFGAPPLGYAAHFDWPRVVASYFPAGVPWTTPRHIAYGWLPGSPRLGYLYVPRFDGGSWGDEVDEALAYLDGAVGLVVDIRGNGGGSELNAGRIAQRLADRKRLYKLSYCRNGPGHGDFTPPRSLALEPGGARRFTGPVVLLTNRYNGSAAEDFVLMLRSLPAVTVIGDTTTGNGTNPLPRELPNGWTFRLSQCYLSTPDGFVYEWRGLPPHVPVPWPAGAAADPYLDAAMQRLRGQ